MSRRIKFSFAVLFLIVIDVIARSLFDVRKIEPSEVFFLAALTTWLLEDAD